MKYTEGDRTISVKTMKYGDTTVVVTSTMNSQGTVIDITSMEGDPNNDNITHTQIINREWLAIKEIRYKPTTITDRPYIDMVFVVLNVKLTYRDKLRILSPDVEYTGTSGLHIIKLLGDADYRQFDITGLSKHPRDVKLACRATDYMLDHGIIITQHGINKCTPLILNEV